MSLYEVKNKNLLKLNETSEDPLGMEKETMYNIETGEVLRDIGIDKRGYMDEPELMSMYYQTENIWKKQPGNFDISVTHKDKRGVMVMKEFKTHGAQLLVPKRKEVRTVGRPRNVTASGGFLGFKGWYRQE